MDFNDIQKLRAFFTGIKENGFKKIPSFAIVDGQRTPIDKEHCLQLLRQLPQFQGDEFKDENAILEYLRDPNKRNFLLGEFKEGRVELTEALAEKPVTTTVVAEQPAAAQEAPLPTGEPAGTMSDAAGFGLPVMGGSAGVSPQRRVVRRVPRAPEPTPGSTTASGASAKVTMTTPAAGTTTTTSSGLSGNLTFNLSPKGAETAETTQPGKGIKGTGRRFQMPQFKIPAGLANIGKNFASRAGIFLKRNILGIARTILGAFAGGVLTGGNPLAMLGGGIGGATFNAWGRKVLNGTINAGVGISNQVSRGSFFKGGSKKIVFLFLGGFLLMAFGTAFLGALNPGGSPTGGTPTTGGGGLDYTIPFRDPSVRPLDIRDQIKRRFANAQLQNWDIIIQESIANGWNPAFVLALWIEETGAQGRAGYTDALGCAPTQPTTDINLSLRCLFNNFGSYTNAQFADFMCRYSEGLGKPAPCQFVTNRHFPGNLRREYLALVPSGPGALVPVAAPTPLPVTADVSCPIQNGRIICASYGRRESWGGFDIACAPGSNINTGETDIGGHCSPTYRRTYSRLCNDSNYISGGNLKRTAKSIDVSGAANTAVFIPTINNQRLRWFFIADVPDGEGATLRVFQSEQTPQGKWVIHFLHASAVPSFTSESQVDTNNPVARIAPGNDHIHITVGLNIAEPVTANNLQQYDPGWKFPDRELGMCTQ